MLTKKNDLNVVKRTSAALFDDAEKKIRQAKITEAAYYISEKRGFITGYEMDDWLKAEKEIINK
ncbi:MAG: DUF2934 domain-containing protein [Methylococcales bacterium]|nr:DUF2934 domain-containing protein [Methylococcales bacterium]